MVVDVVRALRHGPPAPRNPWNAGTLEWTVETTDENWGVRSVPQISSRYPLWDQPGVLDEMDRGRGYLPDAAAGKRETLITGVLDATPEQVQRLPANSFRPLAAAIFIGTCFIAATFEWWWLAAAGGIIGIGVILGWLWTGTARPPEAATMDAGRGLTLPLYASGPRSVGWWAMCITMVGDATAFISLIFGYFFYWTIHAEFPPPQATGPGLAWPAIAAATGLAAWAAVLAARHANRTGRVATARLALMAGAGLAIASIAAGAAAILTTGLDPVVHVYDATVWVLVIWTALHLAAGVLMQLYCLARSLAGHMTPVHDIDIQNVTLYWHFAAGTLAITMAVIGLFPLASG